METSRRSEEARKQTGDMGDKGEKSVNQKSKKEREQNSKTRKGPMRGPDFSSRGRSSHGQADQLPESSPHSQHVLTLLPGCPEDGQLLIGGGEGGAQEETWEAVN